MQSLPLTALTARALRPVPRLLSLAVVALLVGCQAPVTTDFHRAMTDSNGFVLDVHNGSDKMLQCRVVTDDSKVDHQFTVEPYGEEHIGLLQIGHSFKPGEHGEIQVNGYASHSFTAPQ